MKGGNLEAWSQTITEQVLAVLGRGLDLPLTGGPVRQREEVSKETVAAMHCLAVPANL
jgi:hypothetical protein